MTNIKVTVFRERDYNLETNALKFVAWLNTKIEEIPEEFRTSASIEIYYEYGYDNDIDRYLELSYYRSENAEERTSRVKKEQKARAVREARELQLLEQLKARYGK